MRAVNHIIIKQLKLCETKDNNERLKHVTNQGKEFDHNEEKNNK
jgi:hypothetical protein